MELVSLSASRRNYTITETVYSGSDELSQAIVYFKKVKNQTNAPAKGSSVYHSFGPLAIRSQICLTEWDKALGIYNESFKNRAILLSGKEIEIISDIISKTEGTKLLNQFSIYRNKDFPIILGDSLTNQNLITESELSNSERIVLELISNWEVNGLLRSWDKGGVLINIARNKILNSLAIGLIGLNAIKTTDFSLKTGRLIAQLFLEAEKNNLQIHPVFLPLSLISGLNGNTNASTFLKKKLQRINSDSEV